MKLRIIGLFIILLFVGNNAAFGQFWQGFLYGVGQAAQNYNNQRQYNNQRSSSSSRRSESEIKKTREVEDDGYVWYKLRKDGNYGIENVNGDIILSPKYGFIHYDKDSKTFGVENKEGCYKGVLSKDGTWIIPLSRAYESVSASSSYNVYYVKKNGYEGACNFDGKEIIAPNRYKDILYSCGEFNYKDSDGNWISLNIDIDGYSTNSQTDAISTSTKSSSSSQESSSALLYEGTYTISNQGYCAELGGYTDPVGVGDVVNVKIYNDYIIVRGIRYDYVSASNGWKVFGGVNGVYYKVNFQTFDMSMYTTMYNQFTGGTNTWTYSMVKGEVRFNVQSSNNNYNGNSETINYNNNSTSTSRTVRISKKCNACDGKGWIPSTRGVASFGNEKWCSECQKKVPSSHYHETCPSCKGKGEW